MAGHDSTRSFAFGSLKGQTNMSRSLALVSALSLGAVALCACGDLSQEDLLFRAALPPRDAVALTVPGASEAAANEQALSACVDGDIRCNATELASGFNGLTFFLLDIVDAVASLPPSLREPGRRVWGPHYDISKDSSFRFEMVRNDDGITYSFCLHSAQGRVADRAVDDDVVNCDTDDGDAALAGLVKVFSGSFQPSTVAGDGARQGIGTMRFEAGKVARLERSDRFANVLDFAFDNADDEVHIDINLEGAPVGEVDRDAAYSFDKEVDGSGRFNFEFFVDLVGSGELLPRRNPERVRMAALWQADQSGRGVGLVDEGDLDPGTVVTIDQCWNSTLETIRFKDTDNVVSIGEEDTVCAFTAAEVTAVAD